MLILSAVADLVVILAVHSGLLSAVADFDKIFLDPVGFSVDSSAYLLLH